MSFKNYGGGGGGGMPHKATSKLCRYVSYRYMYLEKAWYLKTYMDTDGSILIMFEKLH